MATRNARRILTAAISTAASGDSNVVVVPAGQFLQVVGIVLIAAAPVSVTLKSQAAALTGALPLGANSGFAPQGTQEAPLLKTLVAGDDLVINLGAAVQVSGWVTYTISAL